MNTPVCLNYQQTSFLSSAELFFQCPSDTGAEVAFAGRSNAGKSSVINSLTGQNKLARVSKTPGRTQLINFFNITDHQRLVDLPGYGYAKVPEVIRDRWQHELDQYFQQRRSLLGLIIIMDVRHPLTAFDQAMMSFAEARNLPAHILLNKADKLKYGAARSQLLKVNTELQKRPMHYSVQLFSAFKKTGLEQLQEKLNSWLTL